MDGQYRKDIYPGLEVGIILKKDQRSGKKTYGIVKDLLTSAAWHSRSERSDISLIFTTGYSAP